MRTDTAPSPSIASTDNNLNVQTLDPVLWLLTVANFLVGMGAFLVVGLLSPIQIALDISLNQAGYLLSIYAFTYAVGSPVGVALTGRFDRKTVLIGCMVVFTLATLLTATASNYGQLMGARIMTAIAAGILTPVTASIALSGSTSENSGKSLARVFLGFTFAQVLGIPVGSYLGHTFGWQTAFHLVFILANVVTVVLIFSVKRNILVEFNDFAILKSALMDFREMISVLCTSTFICGIYIVYTFLEPLFVQTQSYGRDEIMALLLVFGLGAMTGNHLGGTFTDSVGPVKTLGVLCIFQFLLMPCFSFLPNSTLLLWSLTFAWSVFGWSFMIAQQTRIIRRSPQRQSVLLALNAAAIYIGAAFGSILGGIVITFFGIEALGIAGGVVALLALVHLLLSESLNKQSSSIPF